MLAVILAGGKGSRLKGAYPSLPKPLVPLGGKPILLRQIECLKREGVQEFLIVTCHLAEQIESFCGDGSRFGVHIRYFREQVPMGTGGALLALRESLPEEFLVCNGDLLFDFTLRDFLSFHHAHAAAISLFSHPTSHPFDSTVLLTDSDNRVLALKRNTRGANEFSPLSNAGVQIITKKALKRLTAAPVMNFDSDILLPNLTFGDVYAYRCSEYVKDAGTSERIAQAENDLQRGLPESMRHAHAQKAVFLDRDGTVNKYNGFITHPDDLELLPGVAEAIKLFHAHAYLVMIATNQPVVARGECSLEELEKIHNRLQLLLAEEGAYVDEIYYCPHHPESGFAGENPAYKIHCDCRKPQPGMLLQAAKRWNIDLSRSFMVGDSERDVQTAIAAGCLPIFLTESESLENVPCYSSVFAFARELENYENND